MPVERANTHVMPKPWGSLDLRPWHDPHHTGERLGEIWFERTAPGAPPSKLLLKLLFTTEPLSIQVHPDDAFAQSKGEANGKTEAWYILAAKPGAVVALGLKAPVSDQDLRAAIENGAIADRVRWQPVVQDDVILVPAGTIHALGAGLVVAEIQQRSDTTYRLFDFGRGRTLHLEEALATAIPRPAAAPISPWHLTSIRTLLAISPYFVLERTALPPGTRWELDAEQETWLLVIQGEAHVGPAVTSVGEAMFLDHANTQVVAGPAGMTGLLAYAAPGPVARLLESLDDRETGLSPAPFMLPHPLPSAGTNDGLEMRP